MHVNISVKQVDILLVNQFNQNKENISEYQRLHKQKGILERYHKLIIFLHKTGIKDIYAALIQRWVFLEVSGKNTGNIFVDENRQYATDDHAMKFCKHELFNNSIFRFNISDC